MSSRQVKRRTQEVCAIVMRDAAQARSRQSGRSLLIVALVITLICTPLLAACSKAELADTSTAFDSGVSERTIDPEVLREARLKRASFSAVGDNLIHSSVYNYGKQSNGSYNFDMLYAPMKPYIEESDISFINQETVCGGTELGLADYPCFNSPQEILDAVSNAGFDWINTASNHSMDVHNTGIYAQLEHIATLPNLTQTGTHASWEDYNTPTVIEIDGLRIGLASYTYGLNGFTLPAGEEYLVSLMSREQITKDFEKLNTVSDVQVICMHWGSEYQYSPNEEQRQYAQLLADLGVDVVVGGHPHVVQPTTMLRGASGNETLVIYSLGNFVSAQDEVPRMLGEMARWTICYDPETKEVSFEDIEIWPTVTHFANGWTGYETYALKDYTDEMASSHIWRSKGLTRDALVELSRKVFGDEFKLII